MAREDRAEVVVIGSGASGAPIAFEGLFCDPAHKGNVKFAAWEAIGHTCHSNYPKPHRCDPSRKFHR